MGPGRAVGVIFTKPWGKKLYNIIKGAVAMPGSMERAETEFKSSSANNSFIETEVFRVL